MSFKRLENGVGLPFYLRSDVTIKITKKGSCFFLLYVSLCIFPLSFSFSSLSLPLIIHVHACTYTSLPVCMCVPTPVRLSICFSLWAFLCLFQLSSGLWSERCHLSLFFDSAPWFVSHFCHCTSVSLLLACAFDLPRLLPLSAKRAREKREHPDSLPLPFLLSPSVPEPEFTSQPCHTTPCSQNSRS